MANNYFSDLGPNFRKTTLKFKPIPAYAYDGTLAGEYKAKIQSDLNAYDAERIRLAGELNELTELRNAEDLKLQKVDTDLEQMRHALRMTDAMTTRFLRLGAPRLARVEGVVETVHRAQKGGFARKGGIFDK